MATTPSNESQLKRLIREAGFSYQTVDRRRVEVIFTGPFRPWTVHTTLNEHWFTAWTVVCRVPEAPGRRAELADLLLLLNEENALARYAQKNDLVYLQLNYRAEHLGAEAMSGLMAMLPSIGDRDYPRIVRVLTGDSTLQRLEKQFDRRSA